MIKLQPHEKRGVVIVPSKQAKSLSIIAKICSLKSVKNPLKFVRFVSPNL